MAKTLIWAVALIVSALIVATGGIGAQRIPIQADDDDDDTPRMTPKPVEVVSGRFTCPGRLPAAVIIFEGTSGFVNNGFEVRRAMGASSANCTIVADALTLRAQQLGCVTSPLSISLFPEFGLVCQGERNNVVRVAGALATELLTVPLTP